MAKRRERGEGSLYKRADGMWIGRVDLPPDETGRRPQKTVSSRDKATAIAKLRDLRRDVANGLVAPAPDRLTVESWMQTWLDTIAKPRLRPRTLQTYRSAVKCNIVPHIGDKKLAKLTPAQVLAMHQMILKAGRSTRTAEIAHKTLTKALDDAVRHGKISRNVAEHVDGPKVLSTKRKGITSKQAKIFLRSAIEREDPMATRWAAALLTGARQGELLGLQWSQVDFENRMIYFEWQLQRLPLKKGAGPQAPDRFDVEPAFKHIPLYRGWALTPLKTEGSERDIPLPEPLAALLLKYKSQWRSNPWNLIWVSDRGTPISSRDDTAAWKAALRTAGVPVIVMHAARNTTATLLLEAGVDAHVVAAIVGHTDVVTTRGYQWVNPEYARKALSNLDSLLAVSDT